MNKQEIEEANDKLLAKREQDKEHRTASPHRPDPDKAPKRQDGSEKPLPPRSDFQIWAAHDPFEPVNLGSNLAKWEEFDWDRHPKLRPAKRVIVDWYNGLPDVGALVLAGDVGCGKTHLADAIANLYGRWRIAYYGEVEFLKEIQASYDQRNDHSEVSVIRSMFRHDLLIIDDLGTYRTNNTDWLDNIYGRIFNDYLTVKAKPLLITTNLPMFIFDDKGDILPGGIAERIGARSFSRLCDALGKVEQGRYIDLFGIEDMRVEGYLG